MKILQELPLVQRARQLRHTFVQGRDEKYYKILTFKLYDFKPSPEFATHETNVEEVNERGGRTVVFASHDLGFVREVADEVAFLRSGRVAGRVDTAGLSLDDLGERYADALAARPAERAGQAVGLAG